MIDERTLRSVEAHLRSVAALADPPLLVTIFVREGPGDKGRIVTNDETAMAAAEAQGEVTG